MKLTLIIAELFFTFLLSNSNLSSECTDEFSSLLGALYSAQDIRKIDPTDILNKSPLGTFELENGTNCDENSDCKMAVLAGNQNLENSTQTIVDICKRNKRKKCASKNIKGLLEKAKLADEKSKVSDNFKRKSGLNAANAIQEDGNRIIIYDVNTQGNIAAHEHEQLHYILYEMGIKDKLHHKMIKEIHGDRYDYSDEGATMRRE